MVVAEIAAGDKIGFGYTYGDEATGTAIKEHLERAVIGRNAFAIPDCWAAMVHTIRNVGRPGIASMAIACVDVALWDLKAKLLGLPIVDLLGAARSSVPAYG